MMCYVEIITYLEPCISLRIQGEFDETINAYGTTNYVVIQPGSHQTAIAMLS